MPIERARLADALARVMADPLAVMRFVDGNKQQYRSATILCETTAGNDIIRVDCFNEEENNTNIRVVATYSRPNLWSHLLPFTLSDIIRRDDFVT